MAVKMYQVLKGQKYTGKHRVYKGADGKVKKEGDIFPATELYGNEDNIKMALEGQKGSETKAAKKPKIKLVSNGSKAAGK